MVGVLESERLKNRLWCAEILRITRRQLSHESRTEGVSRSFAAIGLRISLGNIEKSVCSEPQSRMWTAHHMGRVPP